PGQFVTLVVVAALLAVKGTAETPSKQSPSVGANYKQAHKYSNELLKQFMYSPAVEPHWIGKSDSFWYEYRTSKGKQWYRVNPSLKTKEPLFDRVRLAGGLSEEIHKPLDPLQLPLTSGSLSDDGAKFKFVADGYLFEFELVANKLVKLGKAPTTPFGNPK